MKVTMFPLLAKIDGEFVSSAISWSSASGQSGCKKIAAAGSAYRPPFGRDGIALVRPARSTYTPQPEKRESAQKLGKEFA